MVVGGNWVNINCYPRFGQRKRRSYKLLSSDFRVSLYYKSIRRQNPILWAALSPDAFCGYLVARLFGLIEVAFDGTFGRFFKLFGHQFEALDL